MVAHIEELDHQNTLVKLLTLIEKWGTLKENRDAIDKLHNWLEDPFHWDDNFARRKYVRFVRDRGTKNQVDRVLDQNKRWFHDHADDQTVRVSHLTLVEKRRTEQVGREIEDGELWLIDHPDAQAVRAKIEGMKRKR